MKTPPRRAEETPYNDNVWSPLPGCYFISALKAPTDQQPTAENNYKWWIPVLLLNLFKWIQKALHMVNKTRQGRYAAGKISPFRLTAKTVQLLFVWGRFLIRHIILVHTPLTYFQALFLKSIIFSLFYLNKISLQAPKYHNMSGGRVT